MKFSFFFICVFLNFSAIAQYDEARKVKYTDQTPEQRAAIRAGALKFALTKARISLKMPKDYKIFKSKILPLCYGSSIDVSYINQDSSIVIGITIINRDSLDYIRETKVINKLSPELLNYDPNDEWYATLKAYTDSADIKSSIYSKKYLERYNADDGGEYYKECDKIFAGHFLYSRSLILNKKYRGIVEMTYFIRQGTNPDVSAAIKENYKQLIISYEK